GVLQPDAHHRPPAAAPDGRAGGGDPAAQGERRRWGRGGGGVRHRRTGADRARLDRTGARRFAVAREETWMAGRQWARRRWVWVGLLCSFAAPRPVASDAPPA